MNTDSASGENPRAKVAGMFISSVLNLEKKEELKDDKVEDGEQGANDAEADPSASAKADESNEQGDPKPGKGSNGKPEEKEAPAEPHDINAVIQAAAEGAARGTKLALEESRQKEKQTEVTEEEDYPPQYADDAEVLAKLEESNPKKYAGLKRRLIEADQSEIAYKQAWQKENPGKRFDPEAEEHADFYAGINVAVDPRDLKLAERKLVEDKAQRAAIETVQKEQRALRAAESVKRIPSLANSALLGAIAGAAKEVSGIEIDPAKPESVNAIDESDPLLSRVIVTTAGQYRAEIAAAIAIDEGLTEYNPQDPNHARIAKITHGIHNQIMTQPESKRFRVDGGIKRQYVPPNEFSRLPEEKRKFAWTITAADVVSVLQEQAKRDIVESYNAWVGAASKRSGDTKTSQNGSGATGSRQSNPQSRTSSTFSSAGSGSGPAADSGKVGGGGNSSPKGLFLKAVLGG